MTKDGFVDDDDGNDSGAGGVKLLEMLTEWKCW